MRFPVLLVSLGSPSTATSTYELILGWRLCTLGFADTTDETEKKADELKNSICPVGRMVRLLLVISF